MLVKNVLYSALAIFLLGLSSYANAGQIRTEDGYVIHYNAFSTEMLQAKAARSYSIVQSKNRVMLNISVRKGGKGNLLNTKAVEARVSIQAINLLGQLKNILKTTIKEGKAGSAAVYYIGIFTISDQETLKFSLEVDPEGKGKVQKIEFTQQFFVD
ncbi:MAG: DUF4426 domain-containing protein [Thiotrichaceae bacterium]|nr:DUF4426 domain-containing protein [Thiotrichaceae bacterium]